MGFLPYMQLNDLLPKKSRKKVVSKIKKMEERKWKNNERKKERKQEKSATWMDWYLRSTSCQFLIQMFHLFQYADLDNAIKLPNIWGMSKQFLFNF